MVKLAPAVAPAILSGAALSSTPLTASLNPVAVENRTAHASGNSALRTVPAGLVMLSGRNVPALSGMVRSWVQMNVMIRRVSMLWSLPAVGML